jgi:ATP/maltotriose-dependent transcriptional regulator MalT
LPEAVLAEAEASAGETDAGLRRMDGALAEFERTEERLYEAEMHRIRGEILLKRNPADTAEVEQSLQAVLAPAVEGFPPTRQFPELAEAQTLLTALPGALAKVPS